MEKISVIIPVYNVERYLERCIDSVLSQTYKNLEVICIDDGSADGSGELLDKLAERDDRLIVRHEQNGGSSAARNKGLEIASGEYVTFIDSDDYVDRDFFETLQKNMTEDVDMVVTQAMYSDESGKTVYVLDPPADIKNTYKDTRNYMGQNRHFWVWGVLYRKSLINDLRFNTDYHVGEDTLFYFICMQRARSIRHMSDRFYHYVLYEQSACHGEFSERKYTELYVWRDICEMLKDQDGVSRICRGEYARRTFRLYNIMRNSNVYDRDKRKEMRAIMRKNYSCYMYLKGYDMRKKTRLRYSLYMLGFDRIVDMVKQK